MYLSNWLIIIVLIGIGLLFYYKKERNSYKKYFKRKWLSKKKIHYYRENSGPDVRLNDDYYKYLTEKCYKQIFYSSNINKRFSAEEEFVDNLNLCSRLFAFINDIRYYPHWNGEKARKDSGVIFTSWYSEEIRDSIKSRKRCDSKLPVFFSDQFDIKENDDVIEYDFHAGDKHYVLIICPTQFKYNKYYRLIIMENKDDAPEVFLVVRLYYRTQFACDNFCYYKLEEFRNDDWLEFLLDKMFKVRIEERKFSKLRDQCEDAHKNDPRGYWYEEPWETYKNKKTSGI